MNKKQREQTLLQQFIQAMSLGAEDFSRELRSPQGQLHVYPRNEALHQAQLARMRGL